MTLILSHLSSAFVLQSSDRLVTRLNPGQPPSSFDALANKTIVYLARDAIVAMSYTGPAYIGQLTTDHWIVQTLTGVEVTQNFGTRMGTLPRISDIGRTMKFLLEKLSSSEIAHLKTNFELVSVGWQWKLVRRALVGRLQPVPMAWGISKTKLGGFEQKVERLPRYWHWRKRNFFTAAPAANFDKDQQTKMFEEIRADLSSSPPQTCQDLADKVERATANAIAATSASNRFVGPNCMSVVLAPPHLSRSVRVTFFPQQEHTAQLMSKNFAPMTYPAAYTPWIVGPSMMHKPSVFLGKGGWDLALGAFVVKLNGPDGPDHGLLAAMSSQRRPLRPTV
jgi:hypothetical protein